MGYDPKEPRDKDGKWSSDGRSNVVSIGPKKSQENNAGGGNRQIADHIAKQHKNNAAFSNMIKDAKRLPVPMQISANDMAKTPDPKTWKIQKSRTFGSPSQEVFFILHPDVERGFGEKVMTGFHTKKAADDYIAAARRNKIKKD